jgi:dTDP-glucose 4,6-dehydratase
MSKKVLLTGAAGFMGAHVLIHFLHNTDWEIVCLDSFRHRGKSDRIQEVLFDSHPEYAKRVSVYVHDLRTPISDQLAIKMGKIDYIVSIASESHVDRSIEEPRDFIENNIGVVLTLAEYARQYTVEKFLHISTDEVYGPAPQGHEHQEGESHRPSNPYSASKAAQEDILFSYWRTYSKEGFPGTAISNTMNIIGEMQDTEKFVPKVIQHVEQQKIMPIHASAKGEIGTRYYLHARNQADALMFLLKNIEFETYRGQADLCRFNIVGEREVNNLEMAQMIAGFLGKDLKYELQDFHSSRPGHDLRYALDGTKMHELGWRAPMSLEESLKKTVQWTAKHREWML